MREVECEWVLLQSQVVGSKLLLGVWLEDGVVRKTSCSWAEDCMTAHVFWEFVMDFACVIASLWVCLISQLFNTYINYCGQFPLQRSFILFKCWQIKKLLFYLLFNYNQFFGRDTFFFFFFLLFFLSFLWKNWEKIHIYCMWLTDLLFWWKCKSKSTWTRSDLKLPPKKIHEIKWCLLKM